MKPPKEPQTAAELLELFNRLKVMATGDEHPGNEKAALAKQLAKWRKPELL